MSGLTKAEQFKCLAVYVQGLQDENFYGQVTLDMQAGNILLIRKNETTKLEEVADGNAGKEVRSSGQRDQEEAAQQEQADQEGEAAQAP